MPFGDLANTLSLDAVTLGGGIVEYQWVAADELAFKPRAREAGKHPSGGDTPACPAVRLSPSICMSVRQASIPATAAGFPSRIGSKLLERVLRKGRLQEQIKKMKILSRGQLVHVTKCIASDGGTRFPRRALWVMNHLCTKTRAFRLA